MKALVTGGAGFIGSNLVALLESKGMDVVVLDNLSSGYRTNLKNSKASLVVGDVRDASLLEAAMQGTEIVFHLAASVGNKRSIDHPRIDAEVNILGTLNVLEAARRNAVRKVVFSSSAGVFGELKIIPIAEDHPVEPDTPYGSSKLGAEKLCLSYAKLYPLEVICLRYFNVYGVNQRFDAYGNVIPIFAHNIIFKKPITIFGDGEQTRDFINVADVARANFLSGTNKGYSGAFNLGSGTSVSINHLVSLIREASGLPAEVIYGNPRPGDVKHSKAEIQAIKKQLGFEPSVKLENGLKEYFDWAKPAFLIPPQ